MTGQRIFPGRTVAVAGLFCCLMMLGPASAFSQEPKDNDRPQPSSRWHLDWCQRQTDPPYSLA